MLFGSLCDIRSLDMYRYLTHPSKKLSRGSVESRRYSGLIQQFSNGIMYTFLCGCIYEGTFPTRPDFSFSASTYGRGFGFSFFVIPPSSFYPYGLLHQFTHFCIFTIWFVGALDYCNSGHDQYCLSYPWCILQKYVRSRVDGPSRRQTGDDSVGKTNICSGTKRR